MASVVSTCVILALWAAVSLVVATASRDFLIIALGDSFSDTGSLYKVMRGKVPRSPYYWNGRFTNSPGNWQDWINRHNIATIRSKDFAIGGGRACHRWDLPSFVPFIPTVEEQASVFVLKSLQDPSLLENRTAVPLIWAGFNDVSERGKPSPRELAHLPQNVATCLLQTARHLLAVPFPYVVVGTVPPVDLSPEHHGNKTMAAYVNHINAFIKKGVRDLQAELRKQGRKNQSVLLWDVHDVMVQTIRNYMSLGFKHNASRACLTYKPGENLLNGVPIAKCAKPDDYIYYDAMHPTSKVHRLLSENLLETLTRGGLSTTASLLRSRKLEQQQRAGLRLRLPNP